MSKAKTAMTHITNRNIKTIVDAIGESGANWWETSNESLLNHRWLIRERAFKKRSGVALLKHCTAFHNGLISVYAFPRDNGNRTVGFTIMRVGKNA